LVRFDEARIQIVAATVKTFKKLMPCQAVTEADVIIRLPKLKTQTLTDFNGVVKLLYGYLPGILKAEYHLHTARDTNLFADLLLDLHAAYPPAVSIMDAIEGMEGTGPSSGNPRKIGLILASKSCTALDYVAVTIAGFDPMSVATVRLARQRGIGPARLDDIRVFGEHVQKLVLEDFKKPPTADSISRVPPLLINATKRLIAVKPVIAASNCKRCGECSKACPPRAVTLTKGRGVI